MKVMINENVQPRNALTIKISYLRKIFKLMLKIQFDLYATEVARYLSWWLSLFAKKSDGDNICFLLLFHFVDIRSCKWTNKLPFTMTKLTFFFFILLGLGLRRTPSNVQNKMFNINVVWVEKIGWTLETWFTFLQAVIFNMAST